MSTNHNRIARSAEMMAQKGFEVMRYLPPLRIVAFLLAIAIVTTSVPEGHPAASTTGQISGKGWTAIIAGAAILLYQFGYQYPSDKRKVNGARSEAEEVVSSRYDPRTTVFARVPMPLATFNKLVPTSTVTVVYANDEQHPSQCHVSFITLDAGNEQAALSALPPNTCAAYDSTKQQILIPYVVGEESSFSSIRAQAIQAVVALPKQADGSWRDKYQALESCWNKLIFADATPSPGPTPTASPKGEAAPTPTSSPTQKPSKVPTPRPTSARVGTVRPPTKPSSPNRPGHHDVAPLPAGRSVAHVRPETAKRKVTPHPKVAPQAKTPSPTPSPAISRGACTYQIDQGPRALDAPSIVDLGDTSKPPVYVDLIEATAAFESGPSLRKQIVDRRVGPNTVLNLERAEVLARLAALFYSPLYANLHPEQAPKITYAVAVLPAPSGLAAAPTSETASGTFAGLYGGYQSCVSQFDVQKCYSAIAAQEAALIGEIATSSACDFSRHYWLPPISAIGQKYGRQMQKSTDSGYDPLASKAAIPKLDDIANVNFVGVPGC